jgi:predicted porin
MKKSLIALAVAGAVSAPAAFAATSNVDIYGVLNLSVNVFSDQFNGTTNPDGTIAVNGGEDIQISSTASRIGFKGAEDLGGGLTAIWQIESGINVDEQNGGFASRNSFVGLKGGWGTALIGNHDTPFKLVGRAVDLFGDTVADSRNLLGGAATSFTLGGETVEFATSDVRADNVIAYISPSWTGFSFAAMYSTDPFSSGNATPDKQDSSLYSLNATYINGPFYLGGAFSDGDALENVGQDTNWRLAGGLTFGGFKVVGQYDMYEDDSSASNSIGGDYEAWMVGGSFTMGAFVFKGNYIEGEIDNCSDCDGEQWALGADYNLSKRTTIYALYAAGQNTALGWGAGASDINIPDFAGNNEDISAFSLGVKHSF